MASFHEQLKSFATKEGPAALLRVVDTIVIEIGNRIVLRSPVGDPRLWAAPAPAGYVGGSFRSNWQYGFNNDPDGELDSIESEGATIQRIQNGAMASVGAGIHFIVNNLPYAERLENGHSSQAPAGMVGLTELEFPEIVARAINEHS